MTYPYQHEVFSLEGSPDSGEDDGSEGVQMCGPYQDASTHYDYDVDQCSTVCQTQHPYQYASQDAAQHVFQDTTRSQSQQVHPWQVEGQYPTHYTSQQPIESTYQYPNEYPDQNMGKDTDEDPYGYSDQDMEEDTDEDIEESPDDHSPDDRIDYTMEQPTEESNQYPYQFCDAQEGAGSYQTGRTAPVTGVLGSPSLTSMDSQPGPSQADATFQAEGTWIPSHGLPNPASPNPVSNSFDPVEKPVTGYQEPAQWAESTLSPSQEQGVRECIARGEHLDEMARRANRPAPSIQHFIASNNLMWTELQDEELIALVDQGCNTPAILEGLGHLGGPGRFDYEVEARTRYLLSCGGSAQRADLAGNLLHDFHQDPMVDEPGNSVSPWPSQEVGSKTQSALKRWGHDEVRRLRDSVPRNNYIWVDISKEFPGRSADAVRCKWTTFYGFDKRADEGAQISSTPHGQQRGREEGRVDSRPFRTRSTRARHQWRDEDDDNLKGEVARGLSCAKMASMGFLGLSFSQIRRRAAAIKAFWTREDDVNLFGMNLKPHPEFDWNSIGQKFIPERKGFVVKERWEFLQRRARGEDIEEEDVEEEDVEEEDVEEEDVEEEDVEEEDVEEEDVEEEDVEEEGLEGDNIDYYI